MSSAEAEPLSAESIDAALAEFVDRREIPGVLAAVTDNDRIVYTCAQGLASRRGGIAMAPDTIFRIASMTKPITSIAIMMLVDEGKVDLDAPLSRYLPDYHQPNVLVSFDLQTGDYRTRPAHSDITIRQLMTHTGGYGTWFLDERLLQLVDGQPDLLNAPFLLDEPGTRFRYSTSTDVLAQIIEPVSGLPIDQFFARRIFGPLGFRDTSFSLPDATDRLASVFRRVDDGFEELETEAEGSPPRGGGGLYSTAGDYCRLLRLLLNKGEHQGARILSEAACETMLQNQIGDLSAQVQTTAVPARSNDFIFMNGTQKFGLGFALESIDQPTGRPAGTASWAGIYNTWFWLDPVNEFGAVVMMQTQPFADAYCVELYRSFERTLYDCLFSA
jgi:CubicO group peptidase (beta-lactamase class C family)